MCLRNVPLANFRSFVFVLAETNPQLRHLDRAAKIQFGRRTEYRIAAQNQQQIDLTGMQFHQ